MQRKDVLLERYLELPPDMSANERQDLLERARYETFRRPGVNARVTAISVFIVLSTLLGAGLVAVALYSLTPVQAAGPVARAAVIAVLVFLVIFIATQLQQRYRAKLLRPALQRLLEERRQPTDSNPRDP